MKDTYTIGEIGKLLKLGPDAIRFYEKKGLVHPHINPNNQYRMYTMDNILELLDVIYYRHLDISLSQIQELHNSPDKVKTKELMLKKREETKRKIAYQQQLLNKVNDMLDMCEHIDQHLYVCSIDTMPAFHILFEDVETTPFFQNQIQYISEEEIALCGTLKQYRRDDNELTKLKSMIVIERQILQEQNLALRENNPSLNQRPCVTAIIPLLSENLQFCDILPLMTFAKQQGYDLEENIYAKEIPLTFYLDYDHYYAQIYMPIKKN